MTNKELMLDLLYARDSLASVFDRVATACGNPDAVTIADLECVHLRLTEIIGEFAARDEKKV